MATDSANPDLVFQPVAQMGVTAQKGPFEPAQFLLSRIFYHAEVAVRLLLLIGLESEKAPTRLKHV